MRLALRGVDPAWEIRRFTDGAFEIAVPGGGLLRVDAARDLPIDWDEWRGACLGDTPVTPVVESFTVEGWSVSFAVVDSGAERRLHAFYAFLERAVHARVSAARQGFADLEPRWRALLLEAAPDWDDGGEPAIVALADL